MPDTPTPGSNPPAPRAWFFRRHRERRVPRYRPARRDPRGALDAGSLAFLSHRIGHALGNAAFAIQSLCDVALIGLQPEDPLRSDLKEILSTTDRLVRLRELILALGRLSGPRRQEVDLDALVHAATSQLRAHLGPGRALDLQVSPAPGSVWLDPSLVQQVLVLLADHGRAVLPEGGHLHLTVEVLEPRSTGEPEGPGAPLRPWLRITATVDTVALDGVSCERMFEAFYQPPGPSRRHGMELALVEAIARIQGGRVSARAAQDAGTRLEVLLPLPSAR